MTEAKLVESTDAIRDQEIAIEQTYVDEVYRQLQRSTEAAQALAKEGHQRGRLGHEGGLVERDAMVYQAARRIASLDAAHEGLVFGRLDLRPEVAEKARYIGRIGLRDDNREIVLIDWRAPAAAVFYQATHAEPQGVIRRRILRSQGERVIGVEDDLIDAEANTAELPIVGEGALLAQLSRARDRTMHSIVATIQAEQDKAIRAPAKGVVLISGGPGTGKTVVALHRVAYLLYSDRRRYETGGVLVVGPSGVFMKYIERVLPSLGETAVALRSLGEVVDGVSASRRDLPLIAEIKGSARMAEVLRNAARQPVPGSPTEFRIFYRDDVLLLDAAKLQKLRKQLLSQGRRNRSVASVASTLLEALWAQVGGDRALDRGKEAFLEELQDDDNFLEFASNWWPILTAADVFSWLHDPEFLAQVSRGILTDAEFAALSSSWGDSYAVEDIPLIDELRYLLGDPPILGDRDDDPIFGADAALYEVTTASEREFGAGKGWQPPTNRVEDDPFAHVLIDEAQDLSPMQWRMVGRRGKQATWTVVGDPAQSSWPDYPEAEAARNLALGDKPIHAFHLSKNYRNSAEIYEFAAAYANRVGLAADLPEAVRKTGSAPQVRQVSHLAEGVKLALTELLAALPGTVAIVASIERQQQLRDWLANWPEFASAIQGGANARVVVLTGLETKGLEFDGILVVAPAEIEAESPTGASTLYVVYTRATQQMITVSSS